MFSLISSGTTAADNPGVEIDIQTPMAASAPDSTRYMLAIRVLSGGDAEVSIGTTAVTSAQAIAARVGDPASFLPVMFVADGNLFAFASAATTLYWSLFALRV